MSFVQCSTAVHHYVLSSPAGSRRGASTGGAFTGSPSTRRPGDLDVPTLVFLNGLGTDLRIWDGVVEELPRAWSVLRYDLRGHGLTEVGEGLRNIAALSADLSELLDRLGVGPVVLCGLSLGGLIAQQFALTEPERVRGVCLCGTAPRIGSVESWQQRIDQVSAGGLTAIAEAVLGRWFGAPFLAREAHSVRGYRNMFERTSRAGYVALVEALRDADLTTEIAALAVPALVIAGELDVATTPAQVRGLADSIGARYELLAQAGHLMCVEQPRELARELVQFARGWMPETSSSEVFAAPGAVPDARLAAGMKVRRAVLGDAHVDRASREASEFDRDFQEYVTRAAWGEVWVRPGLSLETRHLLTIAMLAVQNRQDELAMHLEATRNTGVSTEQVKEALMQVAVYAGAPAAHAAFKTAKRVLGGGG